MVLPRLTYAQRAAALETAAAARRAQAELKDRLKRGSTSLKQVFKVMPPSSRKAPTASSECTEGSLLC